MSKETNRKKATLNSWELAGYYQPTLGLMAPTARPRYFPVEYKQCLRAPRLDEVTLFGNEVKQKTRPLYSGV